MLNTANLEKLGRYLCTLDTKYQREHFRMAHFMQHGYEEIANPSEALRIVAECFCGTSACAVGHAPIVFKQEMKKIDWNKNEDRMDKWLFLTCELFGYEFKGDIGGSELFDFLFGGNWGSGWDSVYNATSWSAADRIAWVLARPNVAQVFDDLSEIYSENYHYSDVPFIGCAMKAGWITPSQHKYRMAQAKKGLTR